MLKNKVSDLQNRDRVTHRCFRRSGDGSCGGQFGHIKSILKEGLGIRAGTQAAELTTINRLVLSDGSLYIGLWAPAVGVYQ